MTGDRRAAFGIRLGDRLTGFPLLVDISDEPMRKGWITNRNKFVSGPFRQRQIGIRQPLAAVIISVGAPIY
jgi:hypothetical protein